MATVTTGLEQFSYEQEDVQLRELYRQYYYLARKLVTMLPAGFARHLTLQWLLESRGCAERCLKREQVNLGGTAKLLESTKGVTADARNQ